MNLRTYVIPQVPGTIARSRRIDGVVESFLKRNYVVPLAVLHPAVAVGLTVAYFCRGDYDPGKGAEVIASGKELEHLYLVRSPMNTASITPRTRAATSPVIAGQESVHTPTLEIGFDEAFPIGPAAPSRSLTADEPHPFAGYTSISR